MYTITDKNRRVRRSARIAEKNKKPESNPSEESQTVSESASTLAKPMNSLAIKSEVPEDDTAGSDPPQNESLSAKEPETLILLEADSVKAESAQQQVQTSQFECVKTAATEINAAKSDAPQSEVILPCRGKITLFTKNTEVTEQQSHSPSHHLHLQPESSEDDEAKSDAPQNIQQQAQASQDNHLQPGSAENDTAKSDVSGSETLSTKEPQPMSKPKQSSLSGEDNQQQEQSSQDNNLQPKSAENDAAKSDMSGSETLSTNEPQPMLKPKQSSLSGKDNQQQAQPQFDRIKENLVLCRDARRRHEETIHCQCTPTKDEMKSGLACGEDCLNRQLFMECGTGCPSGKYCSNKRFQKREYAPIEIFCAGTKGFGLRATDQIKDGQFIIEYVGEIVSNSEKLRRAMIYSKDQHTYFMAYHNGTVIDATKKGNDSRLINHSCDPNAATQKWTVNDQLRIGLFARRTIKKGEEITFNYQFESFRKDQQKCFCGSTNCNGFIGTLIEDLPIVKSKAVEDAEVDAILSRGSMRNKDHLLEFNRLMIRVDHVENRQRMIKHLQIENTDILRLFLATQGLPLIRNWLTRSDQQNIEDLQLQNTIMQLLSKLPLTHKSQVDNCSIMSSLAQMADFHAANDLIVKDVVETIVRQVACQPNIEEQTMTLQPSSDPLVAECETLQSNIQHVLKKWSALSDFKIPKREWRSSIDAIQPTEKPKGILSTIRTKDDFDVPNFDNRRVLPSVSSAHFGQGPWSQVKNQSFNRNHHYEPRNHFKRVEPNRFPTFPKNENPYRWRNQNVCKFPPKSNVIAKDKLSSSLPRLAPGNSLRANTSPFYGNERPPTSAPANASEPMRSHYYVDTVGKMAQNMSQPYSYHAYNTLAARMNETKNFLSVLHHPPPPPPETSSKKQSDSFTMNRIEANHENKLSQRDEKTNSNSPAQTAKQFRDEKLSQLENLSVAQIEELRDRLTQIIRGKANTNSEEASYTENSETQRQDDDNTSNDADRVDSKTKSEKNPASSQRSSYQEMENHQNETFGRQSFATYASMDSNDTSDYRHRSNSSCKTSPSYRKEMRPNEKCARPNCNTNGSQLLTYATTHIKETSSKSLHHGKEHHHNHEYPSRTPSYSMLSDGADRFNSKIKSENDPVSSQRSSYQEMENYQNETFGRQSFAPFGSMDSNGTSDYRHRSSSSCRTPLVEIQRWQKYDRSDRNLDCQREETATKNQHCKRSGSSEKRKKKEHRGKCSGAKKGGDNDVKTKRTSSLSSKSSDKSSSTVDSDLIQNIGVESVFSDESVDKDMDLESGKRRTDSLTNIFKLCAKMKNKADVTNKDMPNKTERSTLKNANVAKKSVMPDQKCSELIADEASSETVIKHANKEESESAVSKAHASSVVVGKLPGHMGKLQIKLGSISSPALSFRKVEIKQNSTSLTVPTSSSTENFEPLLQRNLNEKATSDINSDPEDNMRKLCAVMQPPVLQQSTLLSATAMDQYIKSLVGCVNVLKDVQRVLFGQNNSINESTASKQEDNAESDASNSLFVHRRRPSSQFDDSPSKKRSLKKRKVGEVTPEDPRNAHAKHSISALHQRLSTPNTIMKQNTTAITSDPRRARFAVDVGKNVRELSENIQIQDTQIKKEQPWMPNMDVSNESDHMLLCNATTGGSISELPELHLFNYVPARDADIAIATTGLLTPQPAVQEDEQFKRRSTFKLEVAELVKKRIGELLQKPYTRFFPTENDYIKFVRAVTHKIVNNQNKDELMFSENVRQSTCQLVDQDLEQLMAQHLASTSVRAILPSDN
ncbi:SET domain-containing protein [Ditylenchus destructor]|nr:SET domain-containing protein [Ditylenchus destructor]